MSQLPYQPMHPPQKHVSKERMAEILARHAKSPVPDSLLPDATSHVGESPKEKPAVARLQWQKVNAWLMRTECGLYRCRKYIPGESIDVDAGAPKYQLEMLVAGLWFYRCGGPHDSFKAAREAAQKHLELQR